MLVCQGQCILIKEIYVKKGQNSKYIAYKIIAFTLLSLIIAPCHDK